MDECRGQCNRMLRSFANGHEATQEPGPAHVYHISSWSDKRPSPNVRNRLSVWCLGRRHAWRRRCPGTTFFFIQSCTLSKKCLSDCVRLDNALNAWQAGTLFTADPSPSGALSTGNARVVRGLHCTWDYSGEVETSAVFFMAKPRGYVGVRRISPFLTRLMVMIPCSPRFPTVRVSTDRCRRGAVARARACHIPLQEHTINWVLASKAMPRYSGVSGNMISASSSSGKGRWKSASVQRITDTLLWDDGTKVWELSKPLRLFFFFDCKTMPSTLVWERCCFQNALTFQVVLAMLELMHHGSNLFEELQRCWLICGRHHALRISMAGVHAFTVADDLQVLLWADEMWWRFHQETLAGFIAFSLFRTLGETRRAVSPFGVQEWSCKDLIHHQLLWMALSICWCCGNNRRLQWQWWVCALGGPDSSMGLSSVEPFRHDQLQLGPYWSALTRSHFPQIAPWPGDRRSCSRLLLVSVPTLPLLPSSCPLLRGTVVIRHSSVRDGGTCGQQWCTVHQRTKCLSRELLLRRPSAGVCAASLLRLLRHHCVSLLWRLSDLASLAGTRICKMAVRKSTEIRTRCCSERILNICAEMVLQMRVRPDAQGRSFPRVWRLTSWIPAHALHQQSQASGMVFSHANWTPRNSWSCMILCHIWGTLLPEM